MKWQSLGPIIIAGKRTPACVYPLDDLRGHIPDAAACWCKPFMDDGILVHNAMDEREKYERGGRKLS